MLILIISLQAYIFGYSQRQDDGLAGPSADLTQPLCYKEQILYEEFDALNTHFFGFFVCLLREVADIFRCSGVIYQTCTIKVKCWVMVNEQACYG